MIVIKSISELKIIRKNIISSIGFIPTMGNLHFGHESLIKKSLSENENTIVSIFINPTQFNNENDFENYPKTIDEDTVLLKNLGVNYLFIPEYKDIYPNQDKIHIIDQSPISHIMEGKFRPGHFNGMLTIVLKLFLLIRPKNAYFGEKDYQQLQLVKSLVKEFFLDINIVECETIRNDNYLPLSSRNSKLSDEELKYVSIFSKLLANTELNNNEIIEILKNKDFEIEYIESYQNRRFGAVNYKNIRLIDNILLKS